MLREPVAGDFRSGMYQALGKIGFEVYRQSGSHIVLVRKFPPAQTTIPNHRELDRGTLRAIIRQTGLTVDEFVFTLTLFVVEEPGGVFGDAWWLG